MAERRFPGGAALLAAEGGGTAAWVYAARDPGRSLGLAMAWADGASADRLHLIVDDLAGVLTRRAACFHPAPAVWAAVGPVLERVEPELSATPGPMPARFDPLADVIRAAGAVPLWEHGVLIADVGGLEVARVVEHDRRLEIEIGVGRHDREARVMVGDDRPVADQLSAVVRQTTHHRRSEAEPHPIGRLAPERRLRSRLLSEPASIGVAELVPVQSPLPVASLTDPVPASARGQADDGSVVVVTCAVGANLDLVPTGVDVRLREDADARLVLVAPDRDLLPAQRRLVERVSRAELVGVPTD